MMQELKSYIEEPLKELITLLRKYGFNTTCSCGHYPNPYIEMEQYEDRNITDLYNLLVENGYKEFQIISYWINCKGVDGRHIEIKFFPKPELCSINLSSGFLYVYPIYLLLFFVLLNTYILYSMLYSAKGGFRSAQHCPDESRDQPPAEATPEW